SALESALIDLSTDSPSLPNLAIFASPASGMSPRAVHAQALRSPEKQSMPLTTTPTPGMRLNSALSTSTADSSCPMYIVGLVLQEAAQRTDSLSESLRSAKRMPNIFLAYSLRLRPSSPRRTVPQRPTST